jgi:hypothetical protein
MKFEAAQILEGVRIMKLQMPVIVIVMDNLVWATVS